MNEADLTITEEEHHITLLTSKDEEKFNICKRIRFDVFVEEQGFKEEDEFDE
ncbi:hypothetical protein DFH28DRAFT_1120075 [Melampsora americana]|nr:hypothetical protein DFH28DRAFT_1120075 [Melampsora americana]